MEIVDVCRSVCVLSVYVTEGVVEMGGCVEMHIEGTLGHRGVGGLDEVGVFGCVVWR